MQSASYRFFFRSYLRQEPNYSIVYISIESLDKLSPIKFVTSIGEGIVYRIKNDPSLPNLDLETPEFEGALAPLFRYFNNIKRLKADHKFLIIIDEFDEIPYDLFNYTPIGDTFFHNIRGLSNENNIAFLLVGGENIQIIQQSTDRLNKFDSFRIDYFDKENYWNDFKELIQRPVKDSIEFNDEAIVALYEMTEGNPYYTKQICIKIFEKVCDSRNSFISPDEVERATRNSIDSLDLNNVNHFWKDGILHRELAQRDQIETQRRKLLIAFAEIIREMGRVKKEDLLSSPVLQSNVATEQILEGFIRRGIIFESSGNCRLRPRIFEKWLVEKGYQTMTKSFLDEDAVIALKAKEEEAYVKDNEIVELSGSWGLYRGSEITDTKIRSWLDQFSDNIERRLMFKLLENIGFYDELKVREKLRIIHQSVQEDISYERYGLERHRRDILLSSFGSISKSGPSYTRIYANENKVIVANIAAPSDIPQKLAENDRIKAIVFIDDIIASGETVIGDLLPFSNESGKLIAEKNIKVIIAAICGLNEKGIKTIENASKDFPFRLECTIADRLSDEDKCFDEKSTIFSSSSEREKAKQIARKYGIQLERKSPLGYDKCQLLVVFHDNCPDNTLPILWASSSSSLEWRPLFKRN